MDKAVENVLGVRRASIGQAGVQIVRVGIHTTVENPRRLHHAFEIRDDDSNALLAEGFVRVACVDSSTWSPRDLPDDVLRLVSGLPDLAARQARGSVEMPWT